MVQLFGPNRILTNKHKKLITRRECDATYIVYLFTYLCLSIDSY